MDTESITSLVGGVAVVVSLALMTTPFKEILNISSSDTMSPIQQVFNSVRLNSNREEQQQTATKFKNYKNIQHRIMKVTLLSIIQIIIITLRTTSRKRVK